MVLHLELYLQKDIWWLLCTAWSEILASPLGSTWVLTHRDILQQHTTRTCNTLNLAQIGIRARSQLLLTFFWVMRISNRPVLYRCQLSDWTMKYGFIPVRYSGSGTGSDSSSWHWTSVGTDATTMPSGSCCSMPRAKFFCLVWGKTQQEVLFRDTSTQSSNIGRERRRR